jgi:predicted nucleotidyltransferase
MPYGLPEEALAAIIAVFRGHDKVEEVILFGSRAKGNHRPGSDIDIAIKGNGLVLNDQLTLMNSLDDLNTPYRFDLLNYAKIRDAAVKSHIDRVGIILFTKAGITQGDEPENLKGIGYEF